jgi:hypothetical protein
MYVSEILLAFMAGISAEKNCSSGTSGVSD